MDQPPTTLEEMRRLSTSDFRDHDRYFYRGDFSVSYVIDHIIELADRELAWQGRQDANSLRDFWYNPVKPLLETAAPNWGEGAGTSDWNRGLSKRLSARLSKKVKGGETSYRSLNILDDSRDRRIATDSLEHDKIIFVEKSAAYRKLEPLADVYDLTLVEGSGWSATALIEDLAQQLDPHTRYTFYVLGDYDPAGFGIVEDFVARASNMGITVDTEASRRIGVRPDQLPDDVVSDQKFSVSNPSEEWVRDYGIGGAYGLELEAVGTELGEEAKALRELVVDEIRDAIDADGRRVKDTERSAGAVPSHAASRTVRDLTSDLKDGLTEWAAERFAEEEGVEDVTHYGGTSVTCELDADAVLDGETGDLVPDPYPESRLHAGATSGNTPSPEGGRKAKSTLKRELKEAISNGDLDVAEMMDFDGDGS